jgi:transposase-like protein
MAARKVKRKKVVLSLEEKLDILEQIEKGTSYTIIAERYGIGKSTVTDIKKSKHKLEAFKKKSKEMGRLKATAEQKTLNLGTYDKLDEALYIWFRQQRERNVPVSGSLLQEKARILYEQLHPDFSKPFVASTGFQWRFSKRHGLKNLTIQGEQASADIISACEFQHHFASVIDGYSEDQVFNCDETGLQFRLLPAKTLASLFEQRAEGRKKAKERVTVSACSNVTGSIKLPLLVIGKSNRPRCFSKINMNSLPVVYKGQKNAWVNTSIFSSWFNDHFIPYVRHHLQSMGQEPKALLLLDNCSAHPDEETLISDDHLITARFLPPNVTCLIQPMDQGVLETLKRHYRKSLLRYFV